MAYDDIETRDPRQDLIPMEEIVAGSTPARFPGVYFLLKDREVVYIGKSTNVLFRIGQHMTTSRKKDFDSYSYIEINDSQKRSQLECLYIQKHRPSMNRQLLQDIDRYPDEDNDEGPLSKERLDKVAALAETEIALLQKKRRRSLGIPCRPRPWRHS